MNLFKAIASRRSVRAFQDRRVEAEKLQSIFSAVRLAPSARNAQEWRFILVRDDEKRAAVAAAGGQPFLKQCPIIIVACAETDKRSMRNGELAYSIDLAIAIDHLTLAATAMGLGTCWIGSFDPTLVRQALAIPASVPVVALMALGYAADEPTEKARLPLERIVMDDQWCP